MPNAWIISRPTVSADEQYRLLYEIMGFNPTARTLTLRGRYGHTFDMDLDYAHKYYTPVREVEEALAVRMHQQRREGIGVKR
jgi:hypothetical protein